MEVTTKNFKKHGWTFQNNKAKQSMFSCAHERQVQQFWIEFR